LHLFCMISSGTLVNFMACTPVTNVHPGNL
jgi:hypothetical protein